MNKKNQNDFDIFDLISEIKKYASDEKFKLKDADLAYNYTEQTDIYHSLLDEASEYLEKHTNDEMKKMFPIEDMKQKGNLLIDTKNKNIAIKDDHEEFILYCKDVPLELILKTLNELEKYYNLENDPLYANQNTEELAKKFLNENMKLSKCLMTNKNFENQSSLRYREFVNKNNIDLNGFNEKLFSDYNSYIKYECIQFVDEMLQKNETMKKISDLDIDGKRVIYTLANETYKFLDHLDAYNFLEENLSLDKAIDSQLNENNNNEVLDIDEIEKMLKPFIADVNLSESMDIEASYIGVNSWFININNKEIIFNDYKDNEIFYNNISNETLLETMKYLEYNYDRGYASDGATIDSFLEMNNNLELESKLNEYIKKSESQGYKFDENNEISQTPNDLKKQKSSIGYK